MRIEQFKENIVDCANEVYFTYNGKNCGLDQEIHNSIPTYEIWCGEKVKRHSDFDTLVHDTFFDGKSILDLLDITEFFFI